MARTGDDLKELALELGSDKYPLPEEEESTPEDKKQVSYRNVDVTIKFKKETKEDPITDEKRVMFADSGFEVDQLVYDKDRAILRVPIVLAKEMIYHYDDYDAFRPKEELEAVASYINGVPVTRGHPEAKIVTDREEVLGWARDAEFEDDELRAVLEISDKNLIEDIRSRKLKGVSPGHFSRLDRASSGEYGGAHYDVTQRDIFIDHIAIVEMGRCSTADGCGIILNDAIEDKGGIKNNMEGDEKNIMKGILSKLSTVLKLAEKLGDAALTEKLEELKKAVEEEEEKLKSGYPKPEEKNDGTDKKEGETDEKVNGERVRKLETERDELKTELDEIVSAEKEKIVDELGSLQEVKTEEQLKEMSLDALKSDLELVKALRGGKFTVDEKSGHGAGAVAEAYKAVGRKGGNG